MKQILVLASLFIGGVSFGLNPFNLNSKINFYEQITVKNLIKGINNNDFDKVYFSSDMRKVYTSSDDSDVYYYSNINPIVGEKIVDMTIHKDVDPVFIPDQNFLANVGSFLYYPVILYLFFNIVANFYRGIFTGQSGKNGNGFGPNIFGNMDNKFTFTATNITLNDWAGSKEVLEECKEIITYLRDSSDYENVDAEMPRGVLLEGPPGTGKTLLAKAIANEINATFVSISGSEFVEVFVGVGAMRVRKLFEEARNNKPCVIFIDEIDAIGKQRGKDAIMGNDEREQTLNQLLTEMDGFKDNDGITVMAATNRKDILDNALLRPGRFDRIVNIPLPDTSSRKDILKLYLKNKKTDNSIDIETLAKLTVGFSGAEIKNLINEAAIITARNKETIITEKYVNDAFEKIIVGIMKKVDDRDGSTRKRVAIHESGHAILAWLFNDYFDLQKVSIQASYSGAGGYTLFSEKNEISEGGLYTKDMLIKRLMVQLGGKAAESVFYGDNHVSLGATMDLKQANELATTMIERFGMGDKLKVFYKDENMMANRYSDSKKSEIENEAMMLVNEAYEKAKEVIQKHKNSIDSVVLKLLEKTTINRAEFEYAYASGVSI